MHKKQKWNFITWLQDVFLWVIFYYCIFYLQIVKKMEFFCSLLPGSNEPLQIIDGEDVVYEEIEDYAEEIDQFPTNSNSDNSITILPQPTAEMANPLTIEVDPVSSFMI